ncbi:methyltransferase family protein [Ferruginivarius sediminum]|nr:isoprenylcysteine carboxylmethyltransferase family protein [Ferruginivarius sediminum]
MTALGLLVYSLAWISFGAVHSLLAHPPVQQAMGRLFGSRTRLAYNLIATVHIAAVLALGIWLLGGAADFALPAWLRVAMWLLAGCGVAGLVVGLREYDMSRFSGTWQARHGTPPGAGDEDEPLVTAGLHRYVRHPLYTAGMMLLWGLAQSPLGLATAVWGTLYFVIGTLFEERKLLARYGGDYREYRRKVPAFVPWKGRAL